MRRSLASWRAPASARAKPPTEACRFQSEGGPSCALLSFRPARSGRSPCTLPPCRRSIVTSRSPYRSTPRSSAGEGCLKSGHPRAREIPFARDAGASRSKTASVDPCPGRPVQPKRGIAKGNSGAHRDVTIERLHGGRVQGDRPLRAGLERSNAQLGRPRIESASFSWRASPERRRCTP